MTSKKLYFNLMKHDLKSRLWCFVCVFLGFFFAITVPTLLATQGNDMVLILGSENLFPYLIGIAATTLLGITSFSYLFSSQKVDFFHSLPIKRNRIFWIHYMNGIFILIMALILNQVFSGVLAFRYQEFSREILDRAIHMFGFLVIHMLLLYSVVVLAVMLTGNMLTALLGIFVFFFFAPCFFGLIRYYESEYFLNIEHHIFDGFYRLEPYTSPIGMYFSKFFQFDSSYLYVVLLFVLISLLCFKLFAIRKSEACKVAMAFPIIQPIIRIPIAILSALFFGVFFWELSYRMIFVLFGILCGGILSHCTIEIIYSLDFRKLFSSKVQLLGCCLVAFFIFAGFRYDPFGIDTYLPEKEEVSGAAVYIDYKWIFDYESRESTLAKMDLKDIESILKVAKSGIEESQKRKHDPFYRSDLDMLVYVKYQLKNGKEVLRRYDGISNGVSDELESIVNSYEYKKNRFPILSQTEDRITKIVVNDNLFEKDSDIIINREAVKSLLQAYQADLLKSSSMLEFGKDIGWIDFFVEEDIIKGYYPLPPSFTNTLDILKKQGFDNQKGD